jgi:hypothetical protein
MKTLLSALVTGEAVGLLFIMSLEADTHRLKRSVVAGFETSCVHILGDEP